MLSKKFVAPLWFELRPSRLLRFYLVLIHCLGVIACLLPSALPWYLRLLIIIVVCSSAIVCWRRYHAEHSNGAAFKWIWRDTDRWHQMVTAENWRMLPAYYSSPYLIIVRLVNESKQKRYLVIFCDQLPDETYQQLYVRLKFWRNTNDYSTGLT